MNQRLDTLERNQGIILRILKRLVPRLTGRKRVNHLSATLTPHEAADFKATMQAHGWDDSNSRHAAAQ